jgi:hypothetical protein
MKPNTTSSMPIRLGIAAMAAAAAVPAAAATVLAAAAGTTVELGGLKAEAPAAWKEVEVKSPMRLKQFTVPGKGGDAELVIFYFGQGQGGSVEDNLARWKKQFEPPAGKTADQISKTETLKLPSTTATLLDISGTYLFKARPMDPGPGEPRPNHRMLAAVLETPKGSHYIRLVGPEKTVGDARKDFVRWLKSFK